MEQTVIPLTLPAAAVQPAPARTGGIGAIVERIEAFRRARDTVAPSAADSAGDHPRLPLGEAASAPSRLTSIDFTTDAAGRIDWCQSRAAPLLVGTVLARYDDLRNAIRQRQPLRAARVTLTGAPVIAGTWQADAVPRFEAGRFTGYIGRLRRPAASPPPDPALATREAESLRQVLHELRTPVNAIQGFAEIIQHQLYGPTPHEYRALAANIVADAARMLAGFEELERLARLQTGAIAPEPGQCDLAAVVTTAIERIAPQAEARGFSLSLTAPPAPQLVALAPTEAERLCWRLLTTIAAAADRGDDIACTLESDGRTACLSIPVPAQLAGHDSAGLFTASSPPAAGVGPQGPSAMFGTGFALRLARAEARASGGSLVLAGQKINLFLPLLTLVAKHGDNDGQGRTSTGAPAA